PLLRDGAVLLVRARLQVLDEERPRLIAMSFQACPSGGPVEKKPKHKVNGLFLRYDSEEDRRVSKVDNLMEIFSGGTNPVYYYYKNTERYVNQQRFGTILLSEGLLSELKRILGEENVFHR
ncbi:MAG: hypothetical protein IJ720_03980, partial [Clostridia bacterium]|nr:hypothetical protein [Clostridia bacterium]